MIIAKAPYRVSLFGGGTDYDKWFKKNGGAFISLAIDRYCSAIMKRSVGFGNEKYRVQWREIEEVSRIEDIKQPIVREAMKLMNYSDYSEFVYLGELPSQSGTGSSSAFAVAMVYLLSAASHQEIDKYKIADLAYKIEHDCLNESIGIQDSIASSFGGLNLVEINKNGKYNIHRLLLKSCLEKAFLDRMLLVYSKEQRYASDAASKKLAVMDKKQDSFKRFQQMVYESKSLLMSEQLDEFGLLMDELWHIKSQLNTTISTQNVDELYEFAKDNDALGFKLLGAGGGGFVLMYFKEGMKEKAKEKLTNKSVFIDFTIDKQGVQIINT